MALEKWIQPGRTFLVSVPGSLSLQVRDRRQRLSGSREEVQVGSGMRSRSLRGKAGVGFLPSPRQPGYLRSPGRPPCRSGGGQVSAFSTICDCHSGRWEHTSHFGKLSSRLSGVFIKVLTLMLERQDPSS